ncbi:MAG TPA: hypothetical protein VJ797_15570 [Burkholderiales bacterium]|nr:hypothetical protein [Burkholderiales bacterium]
MEQDLHNNAKIQVVRAPAALNTTAAGQAGKVIDRHGYHGVEFVINYGTRTATDSVFSVIVKEGSATGSLASVADTDLLGTEADAGLAAGTPHVSGVSKNVSKKIGYKGNKRYVSLTHKATVTAATIVGSSAVLHSPRVSPVA